MVERCARCNVNGNEVRLFDAIYEGRIGKLCERCSIIENIPIIKKPAASQLKDSEKGVGVYSRMKRLAGIKDSKKEETFFIEDKLKELNENPNLEIPEKDKLNLIEHFHWEIMKNRRRKGLSQKQLAENIGESEIAIQMLEKAKLPGKAEQLIKKIEQYLQIRLTKISDTERFFRSGRKSPVLLDSKGRELNKIPEPEIRKDNFEEESTDEFLAGTENKSESGTSCFGYDEEIEIEKPEKRLTGINMEKGEFDITKADLNEVKISDLKDLHRKKIEATRKEQIEEQKRIEERNRLIEARKEELRSMKEKESKELDKVLGGTELLGNGEAIKKLEDSEEEVDFDEEEED